MAFKDDREGFPGSKTEEEDTEHGEDLSEKGKLRELPRKDEADVRRSEKQTVSEVRSVRSGEKKYEYIRVTNVGVTILVSRVTHLRMNVTRSI